MDRVSECFITVFSQRAQMRHRNRCQNDKLRLANSGRSTQAVSRRFFWMSEPFFPTTSRSARKYRSVNPVSRR